MSEFEFKSTYELKKYMDGLSGYTIKNELGRGNHGAVFKAVNSSKKTVVIKQIWDSSKEFKNEVATLKKVLSECSEYATCILDNIKLDSVNILITDFIPGFNLDLQRQQFTLKEKNNLAKQMLDHLLAGLKYIHKKGIVHQDIAGKNIMFNKGFPKYVDFGLAYKVKSGCCNRYDSWPCGTRGTYKYTPYEMQTEWVCEYPPIFLKAHDYFSVGCVLLEWAGCTKREQFYSDDVDANPSLVKKQLARVKTIKPEILQLLHRDPLKRHLAPTTKHNIFENKFTNFLFSQLLCLA